ncbi:MAG: TMEM165/GDT1 family protein [Thiotrichales bacterium]
MDPSIILSSFGLLFLAEMGDKSQLMAMTLAHRYRVWPVIGGVFLAFAALNLLAVLLGAVLFRYVPQRLVLIVAGVLFLVFAYRAWSDSNEGDGDGDVTGRVRNALLASFAIIFLAELGDKTQLAMVALASGTGELISVFIGGTLALWAVSLLGILLGITVMRRLPQVWMHRAAASLFMVFGLLALVKAYLGGQLT